MNVHIRSRIATCVVAVAAASGFCVFQISVQAQEKPGTARVFTADEQSQLNAAEKWDAEMAIGPDNKANLELGKKVLEVRRNILGNESPKVVYSLLNLAAIHDRLGEYLTAFELRKEAIALSRRVNGKSHVDTAFCLIQIGISYDFMGKYEDALKTRQECHKMLVEILGPIHDDTFGVLQSVGRTYLDMGENEKAIETFQRQLELTKSAAKPNSKRRITILANLAVANHYAKRTSAALQLYEEALQLAESESDQELQAGILNGLGSLHGEAGDLTKALQYEQNAITVLLSMHGKDSLEVASALLNFSKTLDRIGKSVPAAQCAGQAFQNFYRHRGPSDKRTRDSLWQVAHVAIKGEAIDKGLAWATQLLEFTRKYDGETSWRTAGALDLIGECHLRKEDYANAVKYFKRELVIRESLFGRESIDANRARLNLIAAYTFQGNSGLGMELADQVAESHSDAPNVPLGQQLRLLKAQGILRTILGRHGEAVASFDEWRRLQTAHLFSELTALASTQHAEYLRQNDSNELDSALSLVLTVPADVEVVAKSAEWLLNAKSLGLQSLESRIANQLELGSGDQAEVLQELNDLRTELSIACLANPSDVNARDRKAEVDRLSGSLRSLEREITINSGEVTATTPWTSIDVVRESLPENSVFVDIVRARPRDFNSRSRLSAFKPAHYMAWVTPSTPTKQTRFVDLGEVAEIDSLLLNLLTEVEAAGKADGAIIRDGEQIATRKIKQSLSTLAAKVWFPLQEAIGETEQVIISPDSAMWLVPWNSLPESPTNDAFLIERRAVRLVSSGRDLISARLAEPVSPNTSVIFADPFFDQSFESKTDSLKKVLGELNTEKEFKRPEGAREFKASALPFTLAEANSIQPNLAAYTGKPPTLYRGPYALEGIAKRLVRPRVAVFSTHGFFDGEATTSDSQPNQRDTQSIEDPLLKSGLLLAGCNTNSSVVANDDGVLSGLEILGIDLRGTELVVLSACNTANGEVSDGEGVAGLRQAFQLAGAHSVVASLWSVEDRSTALTMHQFFDSLAAGKPKSEALRQAQLSRIKARRARHGAAHPFFWAAFSLTGQD